ATLRCRGSHPTYRVARGVHPHVHPVAGQPLLWCQQWRWRRELRLVVVELFIVELLVVIELLVIVVIVIVVVVVGRRGQLRRRRRLVVVVTRRGFTCRTVRRRISSQ